MFGVKSGALKKAFFSALCSLMILNLVNFSAQANQVTKSQSYVSLDNSNEKLNIAVIGDSIGDGVWIGLTRIFRKDRKLVDILKRSRVSTGLVRKDYYDWNEELKKILANQKIHMAVVLFGTNDQQNIRTPEGILTLGSKEWKDEYAKRVDTIIKQLKDKNIAIYWLGLPIMRSKEFSKHAEMVNTIIRERSVKAGVKFLNIWPVFADARGRYNAYGRDSRGRKVKYRAKDGVHFTIKGYVRMAYVAGNEIKRDLIAATGGKFSRKPNKAKTISSRKFNVIPTLRPRDVALGN